MEGIGVGAYNAASQPHFSHFTVWTGEHIDDSRGMWVLARNRKGANPVSFRADLLSWLEINTPAWQLTHRYCRDAPYDARFSVVLRFATEVDLTAFIMVQDRFDLPGKSDICL